MKINNLHLITNRDEMRLVSKILTCLFNFIWNTSRAQLNYLISHNWLRMKLTFFVLLQSFISVYCNQPCLCNYIQINRVNKVHFIIKFQSQVNFFSISSKVSIAYKVLLARISLSEYQAACEVHQARLH